MKTKTEYQLWVLRPDRRPDEPGWFMGGFYTTVESAMEDLREYADLHPDCLMLHKLVVVQTVDC